MKLLPIHRGPATARVALSLRAPLRPALATLGLLGLGACGGDPEPVTVGAAPVGPQPDVQPLAATPASAASSPEAPPRIAIDMAAQVPLDAVAYFECDSLDVLEETLTRISTLTDEIPDGSLMATLPLVSSGIDPALIDRHAPIALALAPVQGQVLPMPIIVVASEGEAAPLGVSNATLLARGIRSRALEGGYHVFEHLTHSTARGGAAVTEGLPDTSFRGRFDVEGLTPVVVTQTLRFAGALNEAYRLSQPRQSHRDIYEFSADDLLGLFRQHEQIAFGLTFEGDDVRLTGRTYGSDAAMDPERVIDVATMESLARHVNSREPFSMVAAFDPEKALQELVEAWSHIERGAGPGILDIARTDGGGELMDAALATMLDSFDTAAAVSVVLEPAKAHVAFYLSADSPDRAREAVSLMLSKCELDTWGFEMALPIRSRTGQTLVEDYSVRFDTRRFDFDARARMREGFKTFLGDSSLHLKVATSESEVLLVLGGDTAAVNTRIRDFAEARDVDPGSRLALDELGGGGPTTSVPSGRIVHSDLVQLFSQIAGLEAIAAGESVADTYRTVMRSAGEGNASFTTWSTIVGDGYSYGATFELRALERAFDAFKGSGL